MPDLDDIRAKITPNTRALVVINPNNPTGALYSDELLLGLIEIAREHGLMIFADEVYDKIVYDGKTHTSVAALSEDVLTVTFNSLSKSYRSCGYRAGWMFISGLIEREPPHARTTTSRASAFSRRCACARTCPASTRSRRRSAATRASTT